MLHVHQRRGLPAAGEPVREHDALPARHHVEVEVEAEPGGRGRRRAQREQVGRELDEARQAAHRSRPQPPDPFGQRGLRAGVGEKRWPERDLAAR